MNYLTLVKHIVDGTSTIQVGYRNIDTESVTWADESAVTDYGDCPVSVNARRHRIRVNTSGSFSHAQGVEVIEAAKMGRY